MSMRLSDLFGAASLPYILAWLPLLCWKEVMCNAAWLGTQRKRELSALTGGCASGKTRRLVLYRNTKGRIRWKLPSFRNENHY